MARKKAGQQGGRFEFSTANIPEGLPLSSAACSAGKSVWTARMSRRMPHRRTDEAVWRRFRRLPQGSGCARGHRTARCSAPAGAPGMGQEKAGKGTSRHHLLYDLYRERIKTARLEAKSGNITSQKRRRIRQFLRKFLSRVLYKRIKVCYNEIRCFGTVHAGCRSLRRRTSSAAMSHRITAFCSGKNGGKTHD